MAGAAPHRRDPITKIGAFSKAQDGSFHGAIRTLAPQPEAVDIRPTERHGDNGPDYRIHAGETDLGGAWTVTRPDKSERLSVRLDYPSVPPPSTRC